MKALLNSFHLNGHTLGFNSDLEARTIVCSNKQYHVKALRSSFHLNGHTLGFNSDLEARTILYSIVNSTT